MNPETPDTTFPVIIERWKSREELRREYLDSLSPEELRQVNPADYWVKYGRPAFEREQARKYDPDQPRVPAGNPDGGQWTSESSGSESATDDTSATAEVLSRVFDAARDDANSSPVMSDESSDPLIPGARYAQVAVSRFDRTGDPRIDNTTGTLMETLARAHTSVGEGAGPVYGIMVHSAFGADVKRQDIPGIAPSSLPWCDIDKIETGWVCWQFVECATLLDDVHNGGLESSWLIEQGRKPGAF
jgi:hypothetical protein